MQKRSPQKKVRFAIGPNPSGLCMCGCGRKTKIVTKAIDDTVM